MHADLKWLAENVSEWGGTYGYNHIFLEDGEAEADTVVSLSVYPKPSPATSGKPPAMS